MKILIKFAAILALFIGFMSVFAGSKVLLGMDMKNYNVLPWLVGYNVVLGIFSIFTGYLIWTSKATAKTFAFFILNLHFLIFLYLKYISNTVAPESIKAMLFRIGIWVFIFAFAFIIPKYFSKKNR